MKVTTRFIYGIKFLEYIVQKNSLVNMDEISEMLAISKKYLQKLARNLLKNGLIETIRGPGGGYKLKKRPDEISLYDIYFALEGSVEEGLCFQNDCKIKDCISIRILNDVNSGINDFLKSKKLTDYIKGEILEKILL